MANIKLPKNLRPEDLYLHCELWAYATDNTEIDFTGIKTYKVDFMKEGLGFGITDINIDISPSMQPIIEISFKDFYGNMAFGFTENENTIKNLENSTNVNDFNYGRMFDLPYPKFKLIIKGFLGKPICLYLNVKKISVTVNPNDGSYEIKATFIPNLYGFFADMPYSFLKAVKSLRLSGLKGQKRIDAEKNIQTISDLRESGAIYQQEVNVISESVEYLKNPLQNLASDSSTDFLSIDFSKPIKATKDIKGFESLYFNMIDAENIKNKIKEFEPFKNAILASISAREQKQKFTFSELVLKQSEAKQGRNLVEKNLAVLEKYETAQLRKSKATVGRLRDITIENVISLLVKDTVYLLGKILEAGQLGYNEDKSFRNNSYEIIGKYFPITENKRTFEQIPYPGATSELKFVDEFISALSMGSVEERIKSEQKNNGDEAVENGKLKKRLTNIEVFSSNPYNTTQVYVFISNLLTRSSIPFTMNQGSDTETQTIIDAEFENCEPIISNIVAFEDNRQELIFFCDYIKKVFDANGNILGIGISTNTDNPSQLTKFLSEKIIDNISIKSFFDKYLNATNSNIDLDTYTSKLIFNNGLPYFVNPDNSNGILRFLIEDNSEGYLSRITQKDKDDNLNNELNNMAYDSPHFKFTKVSELPNQSDSDPVNKSLEDLINLNLVIDYSRLKNFRIGQTLSDILVKDSEIEDVKKNKNLYLSSYKSRFDNNKNCVWDLFGTNDLAIAQRKMLYSLANKIGDNVEKDIKKLNQDIRNITAQNQQKRNVFYNQFHHICNNWQNLLGELGLQDSKNIANDFEKYYLSEGSTKVVYEIPLQSVQTGSEDINLKHAIINTEPLEESTNSQTNVLSIMSNICTKNNFMFLSIPGNALPDKDNLSDVFKPYTGIVNKKEVFEGANNFFYILFMPTPENRASYNNGNPVYLNFDPNKFQLKKQVFEIDYGSVDNTVVKRLNMTTEDNKITSESAIAINNIANNGDNTNRKQKFDCSSLSIMEGRSYKISGEIIGNAQIIPTQFFVINTMPIFNGLYYIVKVSHSITSLNDMTTKFEAIKMKYSYGDSNKYIFIPPITLESLGITESTPSERSTSSEISNNDVTDAGAFTSKDLLKQNEKYLGKITQNTISNTRKSLLDSIAYMEGTLGQGGFNGYNIFVGYGSKNSNRKFGDFPGTKPFFENYDEPHPDKKIKIPAGNGLFTTACGRYQIVGTTWKAIGKNGVLKGGSIGDNFYFSQANQDAAANSLLDYRFKNGGINDTTLEDALTNKEQFIKIAKSIGVSKSKGETVSGEWESVFLALYNKYHYTITDMWEFYKAAYKKYA